MLVYQRVYRYVRLPNLFIGMVIFVGCQVIRVSFVCSRQDLERWLPTLQVDVSSSRAFLVTCS